MAALACRFLGDLPTLLTVPHDRGLVSRPLGRRTSVKDLIEAYGVPHTEVAALTINGQESGFAALLRDGDAVMVAPVQSPDDFFRPGCLRPALAAKPGFLVDINVGQLARQLRLLGLDALYDPRAGDEELAAQAAASGRVLLTRDRRLLKRKGVVFGRLIRAGAPEEQLLEVVRLFGLEEHFQPLSRCLRCNALLQPVAKEAIEHRLLPLTRLYYHSFRRCPACDRLYWAGSHQEGMRRFLAGLQGRLARP
ncbi:MAG: Mut7-C RNAse domain-containing protein [Thermodesulfobacteriota bacterium]